MKTVNILAISSSLRQGSYNTKLLKLATQPLQDKIITASDLQLHHRPSNEQFKIHFDILPVDLLKQIPLYDQDIETAGFPPAVQALKQHIKNSQGILLASPEYNYSVSGVTKNWIDWCSRGGNSFLGKSVAFLCAAGGGYGGFGNVANMKHIFISLQAAIISTHFSISRAYEYFDETGIKEEKRKEVEAGTQPIVKALLSDVILRHY